MWTVVQFTTNDQIDAQISTVPTHWIFEENNNTYCSWPPNKDVRKSIMRAVPPENHWDIYPVTILKQLESYESAMEYERKKELETDSSISEGSDLNDTLFRHKRKKKLLENGFIPGDDLSGSSSEQDSTKPTKLTKKKICRLPSPPKLGNEIDFENIEIILEENIDQNVKESHVVADTYHFDELPSTSTVNESASEAVELNLVASQDETLTPLNANLYETDLSDANKLDEILRIVVSIKTMVMEQNNFLRNYEVRGREEYATVNSFESVPKKKFKNFAKLVEYDTLLKNDLNAQLQLQTAMCMCGGNSPKELIRRSLGRFFTDKLATKCSWTGRKNNYSLKNLKIMEVFKEAVRRTFPKTYTDKIFEEYVMLWFRQSQLRLNRAEQPK